MARNNKGLHEFTVQEANNFDAYTDWNYEVLDMSGTDTATYITEANPAKKIVINIDAGDLPFTLTGVLMTSLSVATSDGTAGDTVSLLSFH